MLIICEDDNVFSFVSFQLLYLVIPEKSGIQSLYGAGLFVSSMILTLIPEGLRENSFLKKFFHICEYDTEVIS